MIFFLWLIIGLRDLSVGVDTLGYIESFATIAEKSFSQIINDLKLSHEKLFLAISWLLSQISNTSLFFNMFWAAVPAISIYISLRDELDNTGGYLLSLLCLFALGLLAFFMAGIRQTAAISVILLSYKYLKNINIAYSFKLLKDANLIKFLLCLLLAYNLHNSSILFVLILPLLKIKVRWWYLMAVIALFFVENYIDISILVRISEFFFNDRFANYGTVYESSQSINAYVMQFLLFIICFFKRDKLIAKDDRNRILLNIAILGLIFQSFSGMIYEMARVSFYFSIFYIILVPKAINEYSTSTRKTISNAFCILLLYYLFFLSSANLPEYKSVLL
ncbi:MAG: EpsG family protein [Lachnospiraceae bacterium]|nr:EpsG family protein [Lachnospiraceae bacterium]